MELVLLRPAGLQYAHACDFTLKKPGVVRKDEKEKVSGHSKSSTVGGQGHI